jgi:DNA polymerase
VDKKSKKIEEIIGKIHGCQSCDLCKTPGKYVPGEGNLDAEIVLLGEAPGAAEAELGRPFVGRSGKLLTSMIEAMSFDREDVYITNVCKCRPPNNRKPTVQESNTCKPFLVDQLNSIKPKVIVALGATAAEDLLGPGECVTKRRQGWHEYNGIPVKVTYHPSYCLRNPKMKDEVWKDLREVLVKIGKI